MATAELVFPVFADIPPALQSSNATPDELQDPGFLSEHIETLWRIRECHANAIKTDQKGMRSVDASLGQMLYSMKSLLARPGRGGNWSPWLKERGIARATADRLVLRFAKSRNLIEKPAHEQLSEPTEAEIGKLFAAIWSRCEAKLPTAHSRYEFIRCWIVRSGLACEYQPGGILITNPANIASPKESEPAASPQEPPRGAEGLEYGDVL